MNEIINPLKQENLITKKELDVMLKHAHKFAVKGIYDWRKPIKEEVFDNMRIFCSENRIGFIIRAFNAEEIKEDRNEITQLPAYHIYIENEYLGTFFTSETCIEALKNMVLTEEEFSCVKTMWWISWRLPKLSLVFKRKNTLISKVAPHYES